MEGARDLVGATQLPRQARFEPDLQPKHRGGGAETRGWGRGNGLSRPIPVLVETRHRALLIRLGALPSDAHRLGFHVIEVFDGAVAARQRPALIPIKLVQLIPS